MNIMFSELDFKPLPTNPRFINRIGNKYGKLLVVGYAGPTHGGRHQAWYCMCDCGNESIHGGIGLSSGKSKSCGCINLERITNLKKTHGETLGGVSSPEYNSFRGAKKRCNNPHEPYYQHYGGRGIKFKFESFEEFITEIGRQPSSDFSLDRKNNNGHYEKGNIRWATQSEQQRNKNNNHLITYKGRIQILVEWAEEFGMSYSMLYSRIKQNWCLDCVFTLPKYSSCSHRN